MAKSNRTPWERVSRRAWRSWKAARAHLSSINSARRRILFIFGQQRSGTTMMVYEVLERDPQARVYYEKSPFTFPGRDQFRLRPLPEVAAQTARYPEPLVVAKPLVESGRAAEVLAGVPNSRGLWFYRSYLDNIKSQLIRFQRQVEHVRLMIEPVAGDWRHVGVSESQRDLVKRFYSPQMAREDAAALTWYIRNSFYFDHGYDRLPVMSLLKYEDVTSRPGDAIRRLYEFLELDYPGDSLVRQIHSRSVGKKIELALLPEIRLMCDQLQARLDAWNGEHGLGRIARTSDGPAVPNA